MDRVQTAVVGGVPFVVSDVETLIKAGPQGVWSEVPVFRFANAYCVALAQRDSRYFDVLKGSGANFPDGFPVARVMRFTSPTARQVRGPSVFEAALSSWIEPEHRHYFLGSTEAVLAAILARVREEAPALSVAGSYSPPFSEMSNSDFDRIVDAILSANATIVWVGLGTPKQDFVATRLAEALEIPCFAVGAAFDFYARTKPVAPRWMRNAGLEWVFRLASEPQRLFKRYLWGNSVFLLALLRGLG